MKNFDMIIDNNELCGGLTITCKELGVYIEIKEAELLAEQIRLDNLANEKSFNLNWIDMR